LYLLYRNIVVSNLQDGIFLKLVKQLAHKNKMNIYTSPTNIDDYKSDNKVHILSNKYFSEYSVVVNTKYLLVSNLQLLR